VRQLTAVHVGLGGKTLSEETVRDDEDRIAGRAEVLEGGLHRAGAGRRELDDLVLRAEDLLKALGDPLQRAPEVRRAVMDHGRRSRREHLGRNRRGARRDEVALLGHYVALTTENRGNSTGRGTR
jgi:hypothetical protein